MRTTLKLENHQLPTFKKALEEYDKKYSTLIDYFGIIGPQLDQLYKAIESAKDGEFIKLTPVVLTRVPEIDKPSTSFPSSITEVRFFKTYINSFVFLEEQQVKGSGQRLS